MTRTRKPMTLAIHPNTYGMGWMVFHGLHTPHDWGLLRARKDKNHACLARVERLIDVHLPETLLLESFEQGAGRRGTRVHRLCQAIVDLAQSRGVDVVVYTFNQVKACFGRIGARTRDEIAEAIGRQFVVLRNRLPRRRKAWHSIDHRQALFSATALILTHQRLDASGLVERLNDD